MRQHTIYKTRFEPSTEKIKIAINNEIPASLNTKEKRKRDGIFNTEQQITSYIVENTLGKLCNDKKAEIGITDESKSLILEKFQEYRNWLLTLTICDPACGSGAFLKEAFDFLLREHHFIGKAESKIQGTRVGHLDMSNVILEKNLFGVDINEESIEITKLALWLHSAKPNHRLNFLDENIKCGNSLISDPKIDPEKAFDWHKEFPHVFKKGGFDVVIGNPPYVDSETMTKFKPLERQALSNLYSVATGNWDLFVIFIERATQLVRDYGMVSMIVPNKLFASKYSVDARLLLADKNLMSIADYSKVKVFESADVYPCVFVLENSNACGDVKIIRMQTPEIIAYVNTINSKILKNEKYWDRFFVAHSTASLLKKLNGFTTLKQYLPDLFGGATVAEAYLLKEKIVEHDNQNKKYKRLVNTGTIDRYVSLWNHYQTQYIKDKYNAPIIFDDDIKKINATRLNQSASPKIIVAGMSLRPEAFFDKGEYIAGKSTTIIQGNEKKLKFVLTILNSQLISFWFSNSFGSIAMSGGYCNLGVNELSMLPMCDTLQKQPFITLADKMQSLHANIQSTRQYFLNSLTDNFDKIKITKRLMTFDQWDFKRLLLELKKQKIIISLKKQHEWKEFFNDVKTKCNNITKQIEEIDRKIDELVYELYGLTEDEIKIVEG
ncbi:MAG: Eco57I restriction-modification methylase domain-containing protein [Planctomycetaceae bacterium]|jgi:hypothetical protein|nr:Eco57I restriction-modification methylase domain-containing protein [Planctomycetaceae bacterium]